jgi:hypothetical protein
MLQPNKKGRISATFARGVGRDRTADTRIFSPLLYRLSYRTIPVWGGKNKTSHGKLEIFFAVLITC